jgi:predicted ATPase/DNA-binding winged helix-turn-helix (wHTH) protein
MTRTSGGPDVSETAAAPQVEMPPAAPGRSVADALPAASLASDGSEASFGPFRLIPSRQLLLHGDTPLYLGSRSYSVLLALVENAGRVVDKETLMVRAWGGIHVEECNLRTAIAGLRRALEVGTRRVYVATVQRKGYRLLAPVTFANASAARRGLRAPLSKVVGRDGEILRLLEDIGRHRLVTVVGPGGIGKTTVALSAGRLALSRELVGEAALVDLSAVEDPDRVPDAIRASLGIGRQSDDAVIDIEAFLSNRRFLIVLDGCEKMVAAVAGMAERVLAAAPNAVVLATSREPLRADGERIHRLDPLPYPDQSCSCAAESRNFASIELFAERAAACARSFELTEATTPIVARICRQLDGIPLAIELAASRLDAFDLPVLAELLDGPFCLHMLGRITALPRHRTLAATLDWSFDTLTKQERIAFRRLSVFRGPFSYDAAREIVSDDQLAFDEVDAIIARLSAKSILSTGTGHAQGKHRLLDITRAYALGKLEQSGEKDIFVARYADYGKSAAKQGGIGPQTPS